MFYDVIVIGGGPAGMTAATAIARQSLKCALLTQSLGGQLNLAPAISNWPAQEKIGGKELTAQLLQQLQSSASTTTVSEKVQVKKVRLVEHSSGLPTYSVLTDNSEELKTRALILAMGAHHKTLGLPGEAQLTGKGVSYCAACDSPYYKDKVVAVIGYGPEVEPLAQTLSRVANKVYLFQPKQSITNQLGNIKILDKALPVAILGQDRVVGIRYLEVGSNEPKELTLDGVFIEAGISPSSESVEHLVATDSTGHIIVDHQTMATSGLGVFAAGDITNGHFKQASIAVADGMKAALSAAQYISTINEEQEV